MRKSNAKLADKLASAIAVGAVDFGLRCTGYDNNLEAARWQAVVKYSSASCPWAVATGSDPAKTLMEAIEKASDNENVNDDPEAGLLFKPSKRGSSKPKKRSGSRVAKLKKAKSGIKRHRRIKVTKDD